MRKHPLLWIAAALACCVGYLMLPARGDSGSILESSPPGPAVQTRHLVLNMDMRDHKKVSSLGYNVFDMGPHADEVNALPTGEQAMIWMGEGSCQGFTTSYEDFAATVRKLAGNPKVYGYYLADEPDPTGCPSLVPEIRRRADFIRANAPGHKSFVAATDYAYHPLRPANMHVDLIGLDPYPCVGNTGRCQFDMIDKMVKDAVKAGIPRSVLVPTYQTFGGDCARNKVNWLPREAEMREILARWDRLLPNPQLDVTYSWGHQAEWACPTLVDADGTQGRADLQSIMQTHNTKRPGNSPHLCPTPTTSASTKP